MDDADLWEAYAWPDRCLRVNFVVSLDGHIAGADGKSGSLSTEEDRRIFHMLRAGCDAILAGAGTMRAEPYGEVRLKPQWRDLRGDRPPPALLAVSASGSVPDIEGLQIVPESQLTHIKDLYPRILCEGGPTLFTALLAHGLVDQVALSINGQIGGSGSLLTEPVTAQATLRHAHATGDTVFTLWDLA